MKNDNRSAKISHNANRPYTPDHPDRILIIDGSRSGKINLLLNIMKT